MISYQRYPLNEHPLFFVEVESFSMEGACLALRRFLGDDTPGKPAQYRLKCNGHEVPSPFAPGAPKAVGGPLFSMDGDAEEEVGEQTKG